MTKNYKSSFLLLLFIIFASFANSFSQDLANNPYSLKLITPQVSPSEPYGIESIISVGPFDNYQISTNWGFCETDCAVNRRDPLNFVATDNRVIISGSNYCYYTTNGGVSWGTASVPVSQGDPVFASDSLGNLFFAVLQSGVLIYKSTNKGVSWTSLGMIVSNGNADKEWIACDQTNGTYKNNVYMAYVNFATGGGVDLWRSTNNGTSWLGPIIIASGNQGANPGPNIAVGRDGRVYCVWNKSTGASLKYSVDGGASWSSEILVSSYTQPGVYNGTSGRYCVKGNIRTNGHPQVAVDLTNGPYKDYVYCTYATNPPGPDNADIFTVRSVDKGLTWQAPVRVNNTDATINDNWMADVSVDDNGRVWSHWYDSRNDAGNLLTEIWAGLSTNGGTSFSDFKISSQNFNPNSVKVIQGTEHYYFGDYTGMSGKTMTFPIYTGQDNTRFDFHVYLPDYGVSFWKPVDTVNHGQTALNRLRIPMFGNYSGTVTYTATVTPTPSQGTITFNWTPGNVKVLTGNPDSITLQTVVSSTVPYGNYNIAITGTESGGPRVHTRTFVQVVANVTGVNNNQNEAPKVFALMQNYPNPFNPSTSFDYYLAKQSLVNITVYDVVGREVAVLVNNELKAAGEYNANFNAENLPTGIYYYKIIAGDFVDVKKMVLIK
ncbi:MAG: T9SS C-terminal target domain-containing protein [Ignavibacteriae bacterium]|nr:MAG: T9SS C-terminal target domain-containing protein [Ignavibacteriota bacterium]